MTNIETLEREPYLWDYLRTVQKPIVLYGMGNGADAILDRCAAGGILVAGVFASDEFVRGQQFRGYKVKTYKEMPANGRKSSGGSSIWPGNRKPMPPICPCSGIPRW